MQGGGSIPGLTTAMPDNSYTTSDTKYGRIMLTSATSSDPSADSKRTRGCPSNRSCSLPLPTKDTGPRTGNYKEVPRKLTSVSSSTSVAPCGRLYYDATCRAAKPPSCDACSTSGSCRTRSLIQGIKCAACDALLRASPARSASSVAAGFSEHG